MRYLIISATAVCLATASLAQSIAPRDGWVITHTTKSHANLLEDVLAAVKANKMGVVTQAGPTGAARNRGIEIPENRVVGVFNNDFAVKILALSTAAMIEAPVRMYVTEEPDGTATLSYKTPSHVFAPYADEGGPQLMELAGALDERFLSISNDATR